MKRSFVLGTILAGSMAVVSACSTTPEAPNKPAASPSPTASASPVVSPVASPAGSPDVNKGGNTNVNTGGNSNFNKVTPPANATPKQ